MNSMVRASEGTDLRCDVYPRTRLTKESATKKKNKQCVIFVDDLPGDSPSVRCL